MSSPDDQSDPSIPAEPMLGGIPRRGFLQYLAAIFATAALPKALSACSAPGPSAVPLGVLAEDVSFTGIPMYWVTRKTDNLSLGFQFLGLAPTGGNLALTSGTTAGNAYIAITFPPQHVIEDAVATGATDTLPLSSYASGTSWLVFQVPASYGVAVDAGGIAPVPYTLQGVLELCARCTLVVAPNAMSALGTTVTTGGAAPQEHSVDVPVTSFAMAKIDRAIAKADRAAAKRVVGRLKKDAPSVTPEVTTVGTPPVAPTNGQTSIELPHRLLISPDELTAWSYVAAPVTSPENRTELWNARMGLRNPATGLADPSLGGLAVRALWTRDYNLYCGGLPTTPVPINTPEPVANAVLKPSGRDRLVQDTGNMTTSKPALAVSRLMLTPLGGTLDVTATFPTDTNLESWTQRITLGRDEYVETVTLGTVLPFGHPAAVVQINKRCDNPANGNVGTIYFTSYVIVGQPLISYQGLPNETDFNSFPFVAVELTQTKIPCSGSVGTASGWVSDPTGTFNPLIGAIGTDHKGRAIKFTTPLVFVPGSNAAATETSYVASGMALWNAAGGAMTFDGQRIAFAPLPSPSSPSTANSTDSTSHETQSFNVVLNPPSKTGSVPIVPSAHTIVVSIDAIRHLATSTATGAGTPNSAATFDYSAVYATNGFNPTSNPNEVFFTLTPKLVGNTPSLGFSSDSSKSGALVSPNMAISALSRSSGVMGGATALYSSGFNPVDFFNGCNPQLFGFVPLASIIQTAASAMPKIVSQQLSNAEAFIQKAIGLYQTVVSVTTQVEALATQAASDASTYKNLAASGVNAVGAALTPAEITALQAAATAATTASATITTFETIAASIVSDAGTVEADITGMKWSALLGTTGMNGDLGKLITDATTLFNDIAALKTSSTQATVAGQAAGAAAGYLGAVGTGITSAISAVDGFLSGATQLLLDLDTLAQGLELPTNVAVNFTWSPPISGIELDGVVAFVPGNAQALSLNVAVNSSACGGQPAGANVTCRLDQFAIAFGGITVTNGDGGALQTFAPTTYTIPQAIQQADVTLVFDHMQFQMLAGQKPDVDVVFSNIYFGGDLKFIETLKDILPLDAFSDPPFLNVTASGISAGFNLTVPNVALGMFSLENIVIDAALTIPFVTTTGNGISFDFNFSTIDNPFLVTVAMLGGGGFFGMTMDMSGIVEIGFGCEVSAQAAISLLDIVSGSVSIEVGIFMVYHQPPAGGGALVDAGTDPITQEALVSGWVFGGYLRLRGELDIAGIITISIEVYLQITYASKTGKCTAFGYIQIDVSLAFFSLHAKPTFQRTFAGSNGDPTFVQLMEAGGVDPMIDPTMTSTASSAAWDPFAEYCMAYA